MPFERRPSLPSSVNGARQPAQQSDVDNFVALGLLSSDHTSRWKGKTTSYTDSPAASGTSTALQSPQTTWTDSECDPDRHQCQTYVFEAGKADQIHTPNQRFDPPKSALFPANFPEVQVGRSFRRRSRLHDRYDRPPVAKRKDFHWQSMCRM